MAVRSQNKFFAGIDGFSAVVVALVAILLAMPNKIELGEWSKELPHVIGLINTVTSIVLIGAFVFVKSGKIGLHRASMMFAFVLGGIFLVCYVMYHVSNPSRSFSGTGTIKVIYLIVLLSHILLSLIVLPLVFRAMYFALTADFLKHKRIARFAYPIWLYVSLTGVFVYLLNYQVYS